MLSQEKAATRHGQKLVCKVERWGEKYERRRAVPTVESALMYSTGGREHESPEQRNTWAVNKMIIYSEPSTYRM